MAGYHCLMPLASSLQTASGILFMLATIIFHLSSLIFHLDASGIFFANGLWYPFYVGYHYLSSFILMPQASFCWLTLSLIFHL